MLKIFLLVPLLCINVLATAQIRSFEKNIALSKDTGVVQKFIKKFKGKPISFIDSTSITLSKYMKAVANFEGKRINSIHIEQKHFGTNLNNSNSFKKDLLTGFADKLHNKTNENVIRKNLFIHEEEIVDPLIIAYNEKWLRDLPFIQDARILAYSSSNDSGAVDLWVVTKDIFPFGGSFNIRNESSYTSNFSTENANDGGNSFNLIHNFDNKRDVKPSWGFDYTLRNISGSFMDIALGSNTLSSNYSNGDLSASRYYIKGNRPLLNPLSKWTWGFDWNVSKNKNVYPNSWSDSLYNSSLKYELSHFDTWVGYQLFRNTHFFENHNPRYFLQLRYLNNQYTQRPLDYILQLDRNYQNIEAYLSSFTLFKQQIIRTQYLYGFGRNEDLPTGKSVVFTAGHYTREHTTQPYLGVQLENYQLLSNENFRHGNLSIGSSYVDNQIQDFRFLASIEQISKLHYLESGFKYRSIFNFSFAQTLKNKFNEALLINSIYGIPQLNKERIYGGTRIGFNWESIWYNSRSFFGFRTSPFAFMNLTYIRTVGDLIKQGEIYSSVGSGMRVRNENLLFGTIELKAFYFPRTNLQMSPWNISLLTNLRYKYNSSIIKKPDFVQIN